MLKTSFVVSSPNRQKAGLHRGLMLPTVSAIKPRPSGKIMAARELKWRRQESNDGHRNGTARRNPLNARKKPTPPETARHTGRPGDELIDQAACRTSGVLFFFAGWHALRPRKADA